MIKAIETTYKGYRFRSRLEARWAVFFDACGYQWEYEPEGFDLGGDWYLPDFRITSKQGYITWYEVKPLASADDGKLFAMRDAYRALERDEDASPFVSFVLLFGDPFDHLSDKPGCRMCPRCGMVLNENNGYGLESYYCYPCDLGTPSGCDNDAEEGAIDGVTVYPYKGSITLLDPYSMDNWHWHTLCAARKARSARFEHGERP